MSPETRAASADSLVEIDALSKHFGRRSPVRAVDGVSLEIRRGECLGLVGESGSGKTTVGRCIVGLVDPSGGSVVFDGHDAQARRSARHLRGRRQMVFQDPYDALNPRMRVADTVAEPLILSGRVADQSQREARVRSLLERVQLGPQFLRRRPGELSGGQRQRVGIARALATDPDFVVLDEPTSALDWMTRSDILGLINSLRADLKLTYLFISHDIDAVAAVADRVAVMYLGRVVEVGDRRQVLEDPQHPYTRALLSAVLKPQVGAGRGNVTLCGEPPSPSAPPSGCHFHPRCPDAVPACTLVEQSLGEVDAPRSVACMRVTGHTTNE
jgi:oligopeptide/dipeptide ABC transporter ATP-binding protein